MAAALAQLTSGQYLRGNFFEGQGEYGLTDRRSWPTALRAWRIGYSMHFIQSFGAEVGRSGSTLHAQCLYRADGHALTAKGAASGRISPLTIVLMLDHPDGTGNTNIGAKATANTFFFLDLYGSAKVFRVWHFLGKAQGDRPHFQIFAQDGKDVHRMNLSIPGNTPRIRATTARPMPHLQ